MWMIATALLASAQVPAPAAATDVGPRLTSDSPAVHELKIHWIADGAITVASAVGWVASETVFKDALAPNDCTWCDRFPDGTDKLNPVDRWARGARWALADQGSASSISDVVNYVALPVTVLTAQAWVASSNERFNKLPEDGLIIAEAVALSGVANQVVKFSFGRERPFVHVLPPDQKGATDHPNDNNLSFYSGHTNFAFALVSSTITVATLRGYEHRWVIWAIGVPLALSVPYLRIAADKHYLTDVLAGAAAGTAFGVGVPLLLHGRLPENVRVSVGPQGASISGTF